MRLLLVLNVQAAFELFWGFESSLHFSGSLKGDAHPESGLRSFEQKPRACVQHTPYVRIGGFMRATACYSDSRKLVIKTSILSINLIGTIICIQ